MGQPDASGCAWCTGYVAGATATPYSALAADPAYQQGAQVGQNDQAAGVAYLYLGADAPEDASNAGVDQ